MSEQPQKIPLTERLKNLRIQRSTLITVVLLVVALTVIITVTVASNRTKKRPELPDVSDKTPVTDSSAPETEPPRREPEGTSAPETSAPSGGSSAVENKLPSFILPVSGTLSKKHDPKLQVYSNTLGDYRVHVGVDIVTAENAPVYAAAAGKVAKIWKDPLMGYCMAVEHSGDCFTVYKNLSETLPEGIAVGTSVRSGQLIGTVGDSAMVELAEEPHLHFEMTVADLSVDPLEYFSDKALESLSIDASFGE